MNVLIHCLSTISGGVVSYMRNPVSLLAKDTKTRADLGRQARQEVLRRFTWEKTWGKALQEIMHRINSSA